MPIAAVSGATKTRAIGPTTPEVDPADLGRDRGLVPRPEVASSWQRSTSSGLAPDRFTVPTREPDLESKFVWAARPVMRRMSSDLADLDLSVILTDAVANVLVRADGSRSISTRLDRVSLGPGYAYPEDTVGTNAIGTALATGSPALIVGREHFADVLTRLSCAAAPIVDPMNGNVIGILDLTSSADDASPLMLGLARSGAREIEQRMRASTPSSYQSVELVRKGLQVLTAAEQRVAELVSTGLTISRLARLCTARRTPLTHICGPSTASSRSPVAPRLRAT